MAGLRLKMLHELLNTLEPRNYVHSTQFFWEWNIVDTIRYYLNIHAAKEVQILTRNLVQLQICAIYKFASSSQRRINSYFELIVRFHSVFFFFLQIQLFLLLSLTGEQSSTR